MNKHGFPDAKDLEYRRYCQQLGNDLCKKLNVLFKVDDFEFYVKYANYVCGFKYALFTSDKMVKRYFWDSSSGEWDRGFRIDKLLKIIEREL